MKRDLGLIKKILIHIEEKDDIKPSELIIKGYDNELANYNIRILWEADFIKAMEIKRGPKDRLWPTHITYKGQELLAHFRHPNTWNKILKNGSKVALDLLVKTGSKYLESLVLTT